MPTKIDYKAIYTPLIEILESKELTEEQRIKMAVKIMRNTLSEKPASEEGGEVQE